MQSLKLGLAGLMLSTAPSLAEPKVTVSIKPIHSIVSALMEGVGTPSLLVSGASSPHDFALKPSDAQQLQSADIVFWVGHSLEGFLEKPLETIAKNAVNVELLDAGGIKAVPFREGGHDDHDHGSKKHDDHEKDEKHADHDDHDHDKHEDHDDHDKHKGHDDHAEKDGHEGHGHEGHGHEEGALDPHIWLDPDNAKAIAQVVLTTLVKQDPSNQETYQSNHDAFHAKLDALETEIEAAMHPLEDKPFVVFHDAYQYFERRFGLTHVGSVTLNPDVAPSANHIKELKEDIAERKAVCVFSEPQFPTKFVTLLQEGTRLNAAVLDPLGMAVPQGPDHYPEMMRALAQQFTDCLG